MKRKGVIIGIVVAVAVLGCLATLLLNDREPRGQGRTLSQWIDYEEQGAWDESKWGAAWKAVRKIGPDAIPYLLKEVHAKDSPPKEKLIVWLRKHPWLPLKIRPAERRQHTAAICFGMLADEAKPAWPVLAQMTYSSDSTVRSCALECLVESSASREILVPVFQRLIHDPDKQLQWSAASLFRGHFRDEADAAGVDKMFPDFKDLP